MFRSLFSKVTQTVTQFVTGRGRIDDELYDELEATLVEGDVGIETATRLVEELRQAVRKNRLSTAEEVGNWLKDEIARLLAEGDREIRWGSPGPTLILVVGVNGTGKTTSTAKLAQFLRRKGHRVLLAAADTFRAAAIDQLEVWAERLQIGLVRHKEGADAASVVFDAVQAARARGMDVVIADTAGRLHTKTNLMEELKKVNRVAERALGRPTDEVLLVLDATIGQNAVQQAKSFMEATPVSGIVLTKLDGTARGGVILTVKDELNLPIKFVGTGEKADDFDVFQPDEFARTLVAES